jgi:gliding motility-associated-like protein
MYNSSIQSYLWNFGDNISSVAKNPVHCFTNRAPDKKVFSVDLTVTSNLGCKGYYIVKDLVDVYPQPTAEFTFNPYATTILNPNFKFFNHSFGYDNHTYGDTGSFNVTLIVENEHGCTDTVNYTVVIRPEFQFYIPNAFTPNGDGINDLFNGVGFGFDLSSDINQYNMKIYDRWGELIFETNDLAAGWDGTLNGKKLESEAFVYSISIKDSNEQKHSFRGTVTLVK